MPGKGCSELQRTMFVLQKEPRRGQRVCYNQTEPLPATAPGWRRRAEHIVGDQVEGGAARELETAAGVEEFVTLHLVVHRGRGGGVSRNISGLRRKSGGRRVSVTADSVAAFGVLAPTSPLPGERAKDGDTHPVLPGLLSPRH